jgi:hypothetical protein
MGPATDSAGGIPEGTGVVVEGTGIAGFTVGGVGACFTVSIGATSLTVGIALMFALALSPVPKLVVLC